MNRTILTIGLVALMLFGAVAGAKPTTSDAKYEKPELTNAPIGIEGIGCSFAGTQTLADNVAASASLTNATGASCEFSFAPIAGTTSTKVVLPPTTPNDFDLYVKRGTPPTTSSYDCRPYLGGSSTETCSVANDAQTVFVMVRRFSGTGGSFTVTASGFTPPPTCSLGSGTTALTAATAVTASLTSDVGANCQFSFAPDATSDIVQVDLSGLASDFDLYVKVGSAPTTSSYDCRPYTGGTTAESCGVINTGATVFAMVRRFSGSGAFTITANNVVLPTLENGVPLVGHTNPGQKQYMKLIVPEGATFAQITMLGDASALACLAQCPDTLDPSLAATASDVDMYVRRGALPTTSSFNCRPYAIGNVESCTFESNVFSAAGNVGALVESAELVPSPAQNYPFAGAGKYFVMINPFYAPAGADWVIVGHTA